MIFKRRAMDATTYVTVRQEDPISGKVAPQRLSKREKKELKYLQRKEQQKEKQKAVKERRAAWRAAKVAAPVGKNETENLVEDSCGHCHDIAQSKQVNIKKSDDQLAFMRSQLDSGMKVCIDLSYSADHSRQGRNSIYKQLSLSYAALKRAQAPIALHITSLTKDTRIELAGQGAENWVAHRHEDALTDVFDPASIIYLSPDAVEPLRGIDKNKVYVIGGIADRTPKKYMSLNRATKMKVRSMRLPIDEYIPQRRTHILNIDTVVSILVSLLKTGDIRTAILSNMLVRHLDQGGKKKRKLDRLNEHDESDVIEVKKSA